MKLTLLLLIVGLLEAKGNTFAQKISLDVKNEPIDKVFTAIEKQTNYVFFYWGSVVSNVKPVTLKIKEASVEAILNIILKGSQCDYKIDGHTITIIPKKEKQPVSFLTNDYNQPLISVRGKVINEEADPVVGVTVQVKGTKIATATNGEGVFELQRIDPNATIILTAVNIQAIEADINGRKEFSVTVKGKTGKLDEVQVIAYGTTTKRTATGNVFSVKAADIEKQPVNNPLLALQGRVPGLVITQASGFAGSGVKVRIQGENSIGGGNDPLYVIDGVPYTSQLLPTISSVMGSSGGGLVNNGFATYGSPLSYINPSDIESIEVLKDADATAIYGSRAANGAILITTKKGKAGEQKIEFNLQQGWGKVTRKMDLMDRRQYLDMRYEALKNDGIPLSSLNQTANFDLTVWDTTRSTDWQKELIGNTSKYTDLQATVSGGNANTYFSIGTGYHRETTVLPSDFNDQKGTVHFQISSTSADQKFNIRLTGNYMVDINKLPHTLTTDLTAAAMQLAPNAPSLYKEDGTINWALNPAGNSTWDYPGNPVAQLLNKYTNKTYNLVSNLNASYRVIPGLYFKTSLGYTNLQSKETVTVPLASTAPESRAGTTRIGVYGDNSIRSWTIEPQTTYEIVRGKSRLEALLGFSIQQNFSDGQRVLGFGYTTDEAISNISAAARVQAEPGINNVYKYNALFGRINYRWGNKYIINITARRDGSSRFGRNTQLHNFGSVAGAWIFSEEKWIAGLTPYVSFGKIKASYGTTGNDQIGEYRFLSLYNSVTAGVPYQGINTLQVNNLPNPYLQWEETRKLHIGIDLGFLKDRILLNVGYFNNRSSNQLLPYKLPIMTGFGSILENFPALVQNSGLEIAATTVNLESGKLKWTTSINITIPKNKLVSFPGIESSTYANSLVVGMPITIQRKFHLIGVDPAKGEYYFGSKTNPFNPVYPDDATVFINTQPRIFGGIQNSITIKGIQVDFLFQFVEQKGPNYFFGRFPGASLLNQPAYLLDRWQKPGDNSPHQRYNSNYSLGNPFINAATSSDEAFEDASFVRLKNVSLSWSVPQAILKSWHMHGLRVFAHGQNLLTLTNYKGLDPETMSSVTLPPLRMFTIGAQVSL